MIPASEVNAVGRTHASRVTFPDKFTDDEFGTSTYWLVPFNTIEFPDALDVPNCTGVPGHTVVVTGAHDTFKKEFLKSMNMTIASEWYVSSIQ